MTIDRSSERPASPWVMARFADLQQDPLTLGSMRTTLHSLEDLFIVHDLVDDKDTLYVDPFDRRERQSRKRISEIEVVSTRKQSPWELLIYVPSVLTTAVGGAILTFNRVQKARENKAKADVAVAQSKAARAHAAAEVEHWQNVQDRLRGQSQITFGGSLEHRDLPSRVTAAIPQPNSASNEARAERVLSSADRALAGLDALDFVPGPNESPSEDH